MNPIAISTKFPMTRLPKPWLSLSVAALLGTHLLFSLNAIATEVADVPADPTPVWTPNVFQAIILGMVQGLTEFIPISSTAHLKVVPEALGWGDPGVTFTAVIQLGSIAAVLWYFWNDLIELTLGSIRAIQTRDYQSQEFRIVLGIGIGTIPIVIVGLLVKYVFAEFYESTVRSLLVIAVVSIVMGLLLGLSERLSPHKRNFDTLGIWDGIWIGLAQTLALIPGVSRSGSTITAGLFAGLQRATAARFSFLLGIPAITLAGLVELKDVFDRGADPSEFVMLGAGLISAVVFSYVAIAWLIRYLQTHNSWIFVWYRLAFGVAILAAIAGGALENR